MDRISELSDELLIKILLFLPTKVAVSTSVLWKRWECLWMWLPKLEFNVGSSKSLRCFLDRQLPLHRAPVIERLCLMLSRKHCKPEDAKLYVLTAVSLIIHELDISSYFDPPESNILPSSLYACTSLVILKLSGEILLDVPRFVCLASLKTLELQDVRYANEDSFQQLLSICPVLKHLLVERYEDDDMLNFSVMTRSLQSLSINISCDLDEYVIETPSLEHFKLVVDSRKTPSCLIEDMPKLIEAYVDVRFPDITGLIRSITSVKRFTLCSEPEVMHGDGFVFNQLEHLKLCVYKEDSLNLFLRLLEDSPNLRVLDLFVMDDHDGREYMVDWSPPDIVPECLLSSLQTFKWLGYEGTAEERDLVVYILTNARHLKTAIISSWECEVPKLQMLRELSLSSRASTMCQLAFD